MAKQNSATATPRLRFPEFRGTSAWPISLLGTTATFEKGRGISKAEIDPDGAWYCIRYGELYTRYGEVIREAFSKTNADEATLFFSRSNDVIVPASGETKDDIATASCVLLDGIALGSDLNVIRSPHDGVFLSYLLNGSKKRELAKVAQGDTVVHLYPRQLAALSVALPEACEQNKIANCLTSLDEVIAAQGRKVEALKAHKRGLMQQLFPREGETRPRLRFPEFRAAPEWNFALLRDLEDKKVVELGRGNVISHDDMRANPGQNPVYSSSVINKGLMGTYGHYMFDEELISWSIDGGGHFFHRPKHKFSVTNVSGYMRVLSSEAVCSFLAYQLQQLHASQKFDYQQKAHPSVIRILYRVGLPDSKEQQRIANCLSSLDTQITAESNRLAALKIHKQGLMQQLFPAPDAASA